MQLARRLAPNLGDRDEALILQLILRRTEAARNAVVRSGFVRVVNRDAEPLAHFLPAQVVDDAGPSAILPILDRLPPEAIPRDVFEAHGLRDDFGRRAHDGLAVRADLRHAHFVRVVNRLAEFVFLGHVVNDGDVFDLGRADTRDEVIVHAPVRVVVHVFRVERERQLALNRLREILGYVRVLVPLANVGLRLACVQRAVDDLRVGPKQRIEVGLIRLPVVAGIGHLLRAAIVLVRAPRLFAERIVCLPLSAQLGEPPRAGVPLYAGAVFAFAAHAARSPGSRNISDATSGAFHAS